MEIIFNSFQSFVLTLDSLLSIHYFPNWNKPIKAEEPRAEEIISLLLAIAAAAM